MIDKKYVYYVKYRLVLSKLNNNTNTILHLYIDINVL